MEDGFHVVRIIGVESRISQSGNDYFKCRLEDITTGARCNLIVTFTEKAARFVDRFAEHLGAILPPVGVSYYLEPRHCRGRILFIQTKTETSEQYGEQIVVERLLSRATAFKRHPELAKADIPENPPFSVPSVAQPRPIKAPSVNAQNLDRPLDLEATDQEQPF
jgi:hypothetical protein